MLTEIRNRAELGAISANEERTADRRDRSDRRADFSHELTVLELLMGHDLRKLVDQSAGDPDTLEAFDPLSCSPRRKDLPETGLESGAICDSAFHRTVALIVVQRGIFDHLEAEAPPVVGGEHSEVEETSSLSRIGAVRAEERVTHTHPRWRFAVMPPEVRVVAEPVDHDVEHRDGDARSHSRLGPSQERRKGSKRCVRPGADVTDRNRNPCRLLRTPIHRNEARFPLHDQVVSIPMGVRPIEPVAGDICVDDVRAEPPNGLLIEAEALDRAWGQILKKDVASLDQPFNGRSRDGVLEIESQAPLAAVHPHEAGREAGRPGIPLAGDVTAIRALDFDHLRAEVREQPGTQGARETVLYCENSRSFKEHAETLLGGEPVIELTEHAQKLLSDPNYAYVATVMKDGSPQVTPMWVDTDDGYLMVNTVIGRVKEKNLRRDPRIAMTIPDASNPLSKIEIRGRVVEFIEGQAAEEHINRLSLKYTGEAEYQWREPGQRRVMMRVEPERLAELV